MSKVSLIIDKFEKNIDTNLLNPSYYYNFKGVLKSPKNLGGKIL